MLLPTIIRDRSEDSALLMYPKVEAPGSPGSPMERKRESRSASRSAFSPGGPGRQP
ncbi:Protein of unknown function [Pyronema omphalodes CBS 100304]|uniref:Uncharacterized protein n=1 Tax=Pyronema omphalodes (strain CBS 100304) TaxID=1076935 RepID=U4LPP1_PYROM|nr:Protein of unknown function [Pyronema omphalodes CBS 100304]